MKDKFEILFKYFPSGEASGEREIIEQVFVQDEEFASLLTPMPGNARLLVGTKGSGKSSFLDYAAIALEKVGIPAIKLLPADLVIHKEEQQTIAGITKVFLDALVISVASKLSHTLPNFVKGNDEIIKELGERFGDRNADPITKLARAVSKIQFGGVKVDVATAGGTGNLTKQLTAIRENIDHSTGAMYVMLDDIDQVSALGGGLDVERIYALLVGVKRLAAEVPRLRIVVTLRNEVWRALERARGEKLDQLDHFELAVRTISPTKDQIKSIVRKRLTAAEEESGFRKGFNEFEHFFEGAVARMPGSTETSSWDDLIATRSRERPRDAIQLVGRLAGRRIGKAGKIDSEDLAAVMPEFSKSRVTLTAGEFSSICPNIAELIESLRDLPFKAGAFTALPDDVRAFLMRLVGKFGIKIDGAAMTASVDHIFRIWRLLYDIGVLNARVSDIRMPEKYRHVYPSQEPDYVSLANWTEMQKAVWEVNPVYRDRLLYLQREDEARDGLAIKTKTKHKRRRD